MSENLLSKIRAVSDQMGASVTGLPETIEIRPGALSLAAPFIREKGWCSPLLVADAHTFAAAGERLEALLEEGGTTATVTLVLPNAQGDVIADEASVVQVLLALQGNKSDVVVAAGSGTLTDIARYAAYTAGLPFVSVPTAPSVDGFTSSGSPLIIRGNKLTIRVAGPAAIFADTDILRAAPAPMAAAGFGDMLGKYTALFDWKFGRITAEEPYSPEIAGLTESALLACVSHVKEIGERTEEGIRILMEALMKSGLAIQLFGQSHPASGAEHHLSHYWEMEYIRTGRRQLLHGAKVGVACAEISALYHEIAARPELWNDAKWDQIRKEIDLIPGPDEIRALLRAVHGPSTTEELGVTGDLLRRSLKEAHEVRPNRHTLLRARNEGGLALQ
ncbi:sn-glycerol-1-phosphate dehydrogenase [Paenibacillus sp. HN-1]|uniref:sn-glycerol-1-phosphate dehydrogenase n=1 Tax=Paenibacillus TaxID=44249 RepID=UPI001CAA24CB|nr:MULTISPECIES: sn-glycerol-1-phosphate dehydrogenase [Paenibacillus]MBY9079462.1 sn-glycerol-1-phosphate dehydrogenase [Paenibacillus sp. CGMCC 1.18879]MBY9083443.1 sn-glycerol-1-phosphate dehydrogenase [Paenibacillus sinensis]